MLYNYLKIAFRNLLKNKTFSLINIFGLGIGMAACLLILQYVSFELSYDEFSENSDRIYRFTYDYYEKNELVSHSALSVPAVATALQKDFPEVQLIARLFPFSSFQFACAMRYDDGINPSIAFNEENLYFADASFLSLFSLPLQQGDTATALQNPYSAVISASTAKKYFGEAEPIGKILTLNSSSLEEQDFIVSGVMEVPANSHLQLDILLSMSSLNQHPYYGELLQKSWANNNVYTYILLSSDAHLQSLRARLSSFVDKYDEEIHRNLFDKTSKVSFDFQPVEDIHLHSNLQDEIKPGNDIRAIYFLMALAVFILLIAWVNYINLATARSLERAKEVGVRKVAGANRHQIIQQLLIETFIVNVLSFSVALTLVQLSSSYFQQISSVPFIAFDHYLLWAGILTLFSAGIIISGFFPALMISSFHPGKVLKGKFSRSTKGLWLRRSLIIFQFATSVALMIGVFTLYQQFTFMQKQDLGIDIHQTLVIKAPAITDDTYLERLTSFKATTQQLAQVKQVITSSVVPGEENEWIVNITREKDSQRGKNIAIHVVDSSFFEAYHLRVLAGRNFLASEQPGEHFGDKQESVILNEEAVKHLGFNDIEEAIGSIIYWGENRCMVVGVVNNFHQRSLKNAIQPAIFLVNNRDSIYYSIKLQLNPKEQGDYQKALTSVIALVVEQWKTFFPGNPFDYFMLEDFFNQQYQADLRFGKIFGFFSGLAILIACLGLLGLSSYTALQRTKEVGIRKVLGASVKNIVTLLSKDFLKLVLIASLVALPLAYWAMYQWLENYAFRIQITWWLLAIPVALILLLALATVSFQTIKTALTNPAKSLRYE